MADQLDDAKAMEMSDRERAIKAQLAKVKEPKQLIVDDEILCIECETLVSKLRLAAKPSAARCIDCQSLHEQKGRC
ncbi:MAG: TraR/DksA C4-type zinc finger protein [Oleispira sp.]|nr:TraR/DksA C4-type zinc finger protein [Oleispira sp.]